MHSPLEQFQIHSTISFDAFGHNISVSNFGIFMSITILGAIMLLLASVMKRQIVPGRLQTAGEMLYGIVHDIIDGTVGSGGMAYMPLIFSVFIFVLFANILGMLPYGFAITSHIALTFSMAAILFLLITAVGFIKHGLRYFSLFLPEGTPILLAPLMVLIELFSYLSRPVSLSLRLTANITAGHIVMKLLASFIIMGGLSLGFFPFAFLTILQGFEIFVAALQAYIFAMLSCVYLNDAINLH